MVTRLLVRLMLIMCVSALLSGCPSREGTEPLADPEVFFIEPTPPGPPVFTEISDVFYGYLRDSDATIDELGNPFPANQTFVEADNSISLLSYDRSLPIDSNPESAARNPQTIFNADEALLVALDLVAGTSNVAEVTVLSQSDTIYSLNHASNEVNALVHFVDQVCDIIPVQRVEASGALAGDQTYTILNDNFVYIQTADGDRTGNDCAEAETTKRYYRLSLNYKMIASDLELCLGEGVGQNPDMESCKTKKLPTVSEAEARAQLVFAWVNDDETPTIGDHKLSYGYLGYGFVDHVLKLFGPERQILWEQQRYLQSFDVTPLGQNQFSPYYLANLTPLAHQNYLLQLGRDVFLVDASRDLFGKDFTETDSILSDRSYQLDPVYSETNGLEIVSPAEVAFDDQDVVLVDQGKLFRIDYAALAFSPNHPDREFTITNPAPLNYGPMPYRSTQPFSQFDLKNCEHEVSPVAVLACQNAHDVEDAMLPSPGPLWQFFTECDLAFGCQLLSDSTDYCTTEAEHDQNPTLGNFCHPSNYQHLNELDEAANNIEFRGFMQYWDHIRGLDLIVNQHSLYLTAKMKQKDLLLRYFYDLPLSEPKADREQVLFGSRVTHAGIQAFFSENNLFINSLNPAALRHNECYKNYQQVECRLDELEVNGGQFACTGLDLDEKLCQNQYREYHSTALFCDQVRIDAGGCNDAALIPVNSLSVESPQHDAKWLPFRDTHVANQDRRLMYLLVSDDDFDDEEDPSDSYVANEGVLGRPSLYEVDELSGVPNYVAELGVLSSEVETILEGRVANAPLGRVDVITADEIQLGGVAVGSNVSRIDQYFVVDPLDLDAGVRLDKVAEHQFLRPLTD